MGVRAFHLSLSKVATKNAQFSQEYHSHPLFFVDFASVEFKKPSRNYTVMLFTFANVHGVRETYGRIIFPTHTPLNSSLYCRGPFATKEKSLYECNNLLA